MRVFSCLQRCQTPPESHEVADTQHQHEASGQPEHLSHTAAEQHRARRGAKHHRCDDHQTHTARAEGRTPSNYDADVHLGYPIGLGRARLNVLLDVFNILNAQRPVLLDQRWGFQESDNASPTPVNPGYLKPVLRTAPTSARLGLRLTF